MKITLFALFFLLISSGSYASSAVLRQWLHSKCDGCEEVKTRYAGDLLPIETLMINGLEEQLRHPMFRETPKIRFRVGNELVEANVLQLNDHSVELALPRTIVSEKPLRYGRFTYPNGENYDPKAHNFCKLAFGKDFQMDEFHGSCRFGTNCRVLAISCAGTPEKILERLLRQVDRAVTGVECN